MGCATCGNDATTIRIGTGDYCNTCGNRADATPVDAPTKVRRSMDIGPRRAAPRVSERLGRPAKPLAKALSNKGPASPVFDLRGPKPKRPELAAVAQAAKSKGAMSVTAPTPYVKPHITPTPTARPTSFKAEHFEERFERAKTAKRSQAVSKFSRPAEPTHEAAVALAPATNHTPMPTAAQAHHEALGRLIDQMPAPRLPNATSRNGRGGAVVAAVMIMGGYVWLQNYPKMVIQSAGNQAGIAASVPSYVPSSFSLAKTSSQPGLVTLDFHGIDNQALTIAQNRTEWDSQSLRDNFVAKQDVAYAPVEAKGLTVYLNKDNQATWVNHGVWYKITGTTRLSREQILKIAYSL